MGNIRVRHFLWVSGLLAVAVLIIVGSRGCRADLQFRRLVTDPIPPSVNILELEIRSAIDEVSWIKFHVSSSDFAAILEREGFNRGEALQSSRPPQWWSPPGPCYRSSRAGHIRGIYYDSENSNAYFLGVSY